MSAPIYRASPCSISRSSITNRQYRRHYRGRGSIGENSSGDAPSRHDPRPFVPGEADRLRRGVRISGRAERPPVVPVGLGRLDLDRLAADETHSVELEDIDNGVTFNERRGVDAIVAWVIEQPECTYHSCEINGVPAAASMP